jgi:hypothetical protein
MKDLRQGLRSFPKLSSGQKTCSSSRSGARMRTAKMVALAPHVLSPRTRKTFKTPLRQAFVLYFIARRLAQA